MSRLQRVTGQAPGGTTAHVQSVRLVQTLHRNLLVPRDLEIVSK